MHLQPGLAQVSITELQASDSVTWPMASEPLFPAIIDSSAVDVQDRQTCCPLHAGIDAAKAKYPEAPKLSIHFAVDASGLLQIAKGEAVVETTEEYTIKVRARSSVAHALL